MIGMLKVKQAWRKAKLIDQLPEPLGTVGTEIVRLLEEAIEEFEASGLSEDELHFFRPIEERVMNADGTQDIWLACGHRARYVIPIPDRRRYSYCSECVDSWIDMKRSAQ
jgi:hypothetical protein